MARRFTPFLAAVALLFATASPAVAEHGDIHAYCSGSQPVITSRPAGTEHVSVICREGLPEFMVNPGPIPTYNPITQARPLPLPPDFGGWVTVWLNGRPLKTPFDPIRGVQEPGAYVTASTGRVMMPVRFFTEAFGGDVDWSHEQRRARLFMRDRGKVLQIWAGKRQALVNISPASLDQAPVIFQDRLFVPVRFLGEGFGAEVKWDHANRSVRVELSGAACSNKTYCGEVR